MLFEAAKEQRGFMNDLAVRIICAPANERFMRIGGTCFSFPYVLHPPAFRIEQCRPFSFMAVGTGQSATQDIDRLQSMMFLNSPGHSGLEAAWLGDAISRFVERKRIDSVGGTYPALKVRALL
jgi:hypothetical protein